MRSTFFGLETGKRALQSRQREQDTIGHNVSNSATVGYSRQRANTTSTTPIYSPDLTRVQTPGQIGTGVQISDIIRIRDLFIDMQIRSANETVGNDEILSTALRQLETVYNEPGEEGISHAVSEFFNHWQELTKTPENIAVRTALVEVANTLVDIVHRVNYNIRQIQIDADTQVKQKVNNVNRLINEISSLNERIAKSVNHNDNPNDMYDKRDLLVDELSEYMEIQVLASNTGQIAILTGGGVTLVRNERAFNLTAVAQTTNQTIAATRNEKTAVFSRILSEDNGLEVKPTEGELGGHIKVRDDLVPDILDNLDEFIEELVIGVNSVHSRGFGLDGTTGVNFFVNDKVIIPQTGVLNPTWRHTNTGIRTLAQGTTTNTLISALGINGPTNLTMNVTKVVNNVTNTSTYTIPIGDPLTTTVRDVLSQIESVAGVDAYFDIEAGRIVIQGKSLSQSYVTFGAVHDITSAEVLAVPAVGVPTNILANLDFPGLPLTSANISFITGTGSTQVQLKVGQDYTLNAATGDFTLTATGNQLITDSGGNLEVRQVQAANSTINLFTAAHLPPASLLTQDPATNAIIADSLVVTTGEIPNETVMVLGRDYTINYNTGDFSLTSTGVALVNQNQNKLFFRTSQTQAGAQEDFFAKAGMMTSVTTITSHQSDTASRFKVNDILIADVNRVAAAPSFANLPGDNTIAVEIARLQNDLKLSGRKDQSLTVKHTATYNTFFNAAIAKLGLQSQESQKSLENITLIRQEFYNRRQEVSGVNMDEELTQLIEVQKSYSAAARFVTTVDEMLDVLINRMGIVGR